MGSGSWTSKDWSGYTASRGYTDKSTTSDMYKASTIKAAFNPVGVKYRESCDSVEHPLSTPIVLCLDVTGSMGSVLETISKKLNTLATEIYTRMPVTDPQIMFAAFGDTTWDNCPLQVTQFESDIRIAEQLNDIYFERGGGGNEGESYILPWYFAARHTKTDSFEKRGKKGLLFTIGDEPYLDTLSAADIKKFVGDDIQANLSAEELLTEVSRCYDVYHLMIEEGSGMRGNGSRVINKWTKLRGQQAIRVSDCTKIPEIIVSVPDVAAGTAAAAVAASWDGSPSVAVHSAISGLAAVRAENGLVEF